MKDWERKCITTNKLALCDAINLKDGKILAALETAEVLTEDESVLISMNLPLRTKANSEMLNLLMTRTKGYEELMKILADLKQDKAYNILKTCKEKCEPKDDKDQQESVDKQNKSLEDEVDGLNPIKKVVVMKPDKPMAFKDDFYRLPTKGKGLALLINVINFRNCKDDSRESAKQDTENLSSLFDKLGYEIYNKDIILGKEEWTVDEIKNTVVEFRDRVDKPDVASIVVFVGSHGKHEKVFDSDRQNVFIWKDILNEFTTQKCNQLKTKPKIFLIEACQKFEDEEDDMADEEDDIPPQPDFDNYALLVATTPGFAAMRNPRLGSVMVHYMTEAIMKNARIWSFQRIVEAVTRKVQQYGSQTITANHNTLGTLYFNLEPEYKPN